MAEVTLTIGGRHYDVHCRDGEEAHLRSLANRVDAKMAQARQSAPGLTEVRQFLFAAILLADEVNDLNVAHGKQPGLNLEPADSDAGDAMIASRLNALSARIEALTQKLAQPQTLAPEGAAS